MRPALRGPPPRIHDARVYRSLLLQTLHYFSRPHDGVRRQPLESRSGWRGADLDESEWREALSASEVSELRRAVDRARAAGALSRVTRADFPLPSLESRVRRWRDTLVRGRGFVLVSGAPVEAWSVEESEVFFWGLGLHLGVPGAQNPQGDLLGHVRDQRAPDDDVTIRAYRTRKEIAFHCDAADAVGLLCLRAAARGGRSRIASSVGIFNELLRRAPELTDRLFEPFHLDTKSEGGVRHFPVTPCRHAAGELRTFYHSDYFREAERHPDAPRLTAEQKRLLDLYDEIAADLALEMDLQPGDVQLLSNHTVVHGRTAYEDGEALDERRHLLRLWLSLPRARSVRVRAQTARSMLGNVGTLVRERIRQRA